MFLSSRRCVQGSFRASGGCASNLCVFHDSRCVISQRHPPKPLRSLEPSFTRQGGLPLAIADPGTGGGSPSVCAGVDLAGRELEVSTWRVWEECHAAWRWFASSYAPRSLAKLRRSRGGDAGVRLAPRAPTWSSNLGLEKEGSSGGGTVGRFREQVRAALLRKALGL